MKMIGSFIAMALMTGALAFGGACSKGGGAKTCDDAAKNAAKIFAEGDAEKEKAQLERGKKRCEEKKPSQAAIDCVVAAKTKDDVMKCPQE